MKKLLVANRGEVAVRIIRAAREMGLLTVAVFSEVDEHQVHVALADEAIELGPSEPAASYLDIDKVIGAAQTAGCDAIHPGYGFLSERDEFAEACERSGITFVGPPASAMRQLGSKIDAKLLAVRLGVSVTPGFFEPGATDDQLKRAADSIGYPVMLKASAGGGGRGMRIVRSADKFDEELSIASDEALKAFGDGAMMVEKLVDRPRHIEVQILADQHGNVAPLFERECSIQRRHQKLIEETPSPVMTPELWGEMKKAAVALIIGAGYQGAGTVEFMYDDASKGFYFLEVNARLQVEHPVTEAITGLDLVRWQLRIASGEPLDLAEPLLSGDRGTISGHAMEARIVAEDPARGFLPSSGRIMGWAEPKGPGVRFDTGYGPGSEIPRYYDSLLAKLIVHGETRDHVLDRMERALLDTHILGVKTNIAYLLDIIRHPDFRAGNYDTGFLDRHFTEWSPSGAIPNELLSLMDRASAVQGVLQGEEERTNASAWDVEDGFRISG